MFGCELCVEIDYRYYTLLLDKYFHRRAVPEVSICGLGQVNRQLRQDARYDAQLFPRRELAQASKHYFNHWRSNG